MSSGPVVETEIESESTEKKDIKTIFTVRNAVIGITFLFLALGTSIIFIYRDNIFGDSTAKNLNTKNIKASKAKNLTDAEWFGVSDVKEFAAASSENQILRENVSIESLFPPTPVGLSAEKLKQPGKFVAIDCEMVGSGLNGSESVLARVSVVNFYGKVLLDAYVRPTKEVVDYRTGVSGITADHLTPSTENGSLNILGNPLLTWKEFQDQIAALIHQRIIVGHGLKNDFAAMKLPSPHPQKLIRDTAKYQPFKDLNNGKSPSLKMLAALILRIKFQASSHDSVDDARMAMLLFRAVRSQWDRK